jgi:hypothetical protein
MFVDTSDTVEYEEFQQYMHNMIIGKDVSNEWDPRTYDAAATTEEEEPNKEENVSNFVRKVHNESRQKFDQQEEGI